MMDEQSHSGTLPSYKNGYFRLVSRICGLNCPLVGTFLRWLDTVC